MRGTSAPAPHPLLAPPLGQPQPLPLPWGMGSCKCCPDHLPVSHQYSGTGPAQVRRCLWDGCNLKNDRVTSVCFQGKLFNITVIQVYAPTSNGDRKSVV